MSLTQADHFTKDFLTFIYFKQPILKNYTPRWPPSVFNMANNYNILDMIFIKGNPSRLQTLGTRSVSSPYILNLITSSTVMCIQQVLNDRSAIELGNNIFHMVSH